MSKPDGHTDSDLGQQVQDLRRQVADLEKNRLAQDRRIAALEQHTGLKTVAADAPLPGTVTAGDARTTDVPVVSPPALPVGADNDGTTRGAEPPAIDRGTQIEPPAKKVPAEPQEPFVDMLMRRAPFILTCLGVVGLIIGAAYGVSFAWEAFGPATKIALGFLAAAGLIGGGQYVARKKDWGWYGEAITGGGWSLAYFVAYAAENITSVKIMDSPLLSTCGLLGLAGAAMGHSIFRKSEAMALLSTLLAFGTISLSPVSGFSAIATGVLIAGLAATIVTQRWLTIFAASTAGSYLTYLFFTAPQIATSGYGFWLSAAFLALFWLAWNYVGFRLFTTTKNGTELGEGKRLLPAHPYLLIGVSLLNGVCFLLGAVYAIGTTYPDSLYLLLAGASVAYFATAYLARQVNWKENALTSSFVALSLAAAATALKLDPSATMVVFLIEVPLLAFIGMRSGFPSFKLFANILAGWTIYRYVFGGLWDAHVVVESIGLTYNVMIAVFAAVAMAATSAIHWIGAQNAVGDDRKASLFSMNAYSIASAALIYGITLIQAPSAYVAAILSIEGLVLSMVALRYRITLAELGSKVFLVTGLAAAIATSSDIGVFQIAIVLGVNFGLAALHYTGMLTEKLSAAQRYLSYIGHSALPVVVGLMLTHLKVDAAAAPWVFAVEVLALLLVTRVLRDRVIELVSIGAALLMVLSLWALGTWTWPLVIVCVATLYAAYGILKFWPYQGHEEIEKLIGQFLGKDAGFKLGDFPQIWANAGTLLLSVAFFTLLSWQHLAVALALQGLFIMGAGFKLKEKQFFLSGLAIFAFVVVKLAAYDLQGAETAWRIISFCGVGVTLLAAGWLNARFNLAMKNGDGGTKAGGKDKGPDDSGPPSGAERDHAAMEALRRSAESQM